MHMAHLHPEVIDEYLEKGKGLGRLLGPFPESVEIPSLHINRFGIVPKGHSTGKWRLITDLSYPPGQSVNTWPHMYFFFSVIHFNYSNEYTILVIIIFFVALNSPLSHQYIHAGVNVTVVQLGCPVGEAIAVGLGNGLGSKADCSSIVLDKGKQPWEVGPHIADIYV